MKYSMLMTLAQKLNTSISKVIIKFSKDKNFVIPYTTDKGEKEKLYFTIKVSNSTATSKI